MSTISSSAIVCPPSFANSWISWIRCTNSWNGLFVSHGYDNFERFPTRCWFSTCLYSVKKCATMSLTLRWENPRLQSNTLARNVLLTASVISFLPACSRLTHPLTYLAASAWLRWRFPEVMLFFPNWMMSWPGLGGMTNKVPSTTIT